MAHETLFAARRPAPTENAPRPFILHPSSLNLHPGRPARRIRTCPRPNAATLQDPTAFHHRSSIAARPRGTPPPGAAPECALSSLNPSSLIPHPSSPALNPQPSTNSVRVGHHLPALLPSPPPSNLHPSSFILHLTPARRPHARSPGGSGRRLPLLTRPCVRAIPGPICGRSGFRSRGSESSE